MRFLKGSTSYGLLYSESSSRTLWATQMPIGVVILMTTDQHQVTFSNSEKLQSVRKSKKQTSVVLSTAQDEYIFIVKCNTGIQLDETVISSLELWIHNTECGL